VMGLAPCAAKKAHGGVVEEVGTMNILGKEGLYGREKKKARSADTPLGRLRKKQKKIAGERWSTKTGKQGRNLKSDERKDGLSRRERSQGSRDSTMMTHASSTSKKRRRGHHKTLKRGRPPQHPQKNRQKKKPKPQTENKKLRLSSRT